MMKLCFISASTSLFILATLGAARTSHGWSRVAIPSCSSHQSPKVSGQSVGSLDDSSDTTIMFGGLTGAAGSPCTDQTWELKVSKTNTLHWKLLEPATIPRARMYAASAVLKNKMILFGGWDPGEPGSGGEFLDDIWEFDVATKEWNLLEDCKLPFPVSRHTACMIPGDSNGNEDAAMIVLHTYQGTLVFRDGKLSEQATTGDVPDGLSMCAVAPLTNSKMFLAGGSTRTQQMSGDAYVLDTNTWVWIKLQVKSSETETRPPPLASACAANIQDNSVVVFGGAAIGSTGYEGGMGLIPQDDTWLLEVLSKSEDNSTTDTARWTKFESDESPDGRVAASLSPIGQSSFLLQGGFDPLSKITFDEPWVLDL